MFVTLNQMLVFDYYEMGSLKDVESNKVTQNNTSYEGIILMEAHSEEVLGDP